MILIVAGNYIEISRSPFGNYAIQFILENGKMIVNQLLILLLKIFVILNYKNIYLIN